VRENEVLRHSGGEAMLAAQWRERFESVSKEKLDLIDKLKIYERGASGGVNGKPIEEAYNELRDEHKVSTPIISTILYAVFLLNICGL
jgi:hypothetical protein